MGWTVIERTRQRMVFLVECILSLLARFHCFSPLPFSRAGASSYSPTLTGNFLPRRDIVSDVVVSVDGVEVRWVSGGSLAVLRSSFKVPVAGLQTVGETRPRSAEEQPGDFECLLLRELDAPDAIPILVEE
jgi:hypothetical protein